LEKAEKMWHFEGTSRSSWFCLEFTSSIAAAFYTAKLMVLQSPLLITTSAMPRTFLI